MGSLRSCWLAGTSLPLTSWFVRVCRPYTWRGWSSGRKPALSVGVRGGKPSSARSVPSAVSVVWPALAVVALRAVALRAVWAAPVALRAVWGCARCAARAPVFRFVVLRGCRGWFPLRPFFGPCCVVVLCLLCCPSAAFARPFFGPFFFSFFFVFGPFSNKILTIDVYNIDNDI